MRPLWAALLCVLIGLPLLASPIKSYTPILTGPILADFEGFADGTPIDNQYPGVTFSQTPLGGRPMINNFPWLYGYGASSGSGVLTGSTEGGYLYRTVAGIYATFAAPQSAVQIFLSDTSPLGDYSVTAYGTGGVRESFSVLAAEVLPPGHLGGVFPPPGTFPLPGIFVGFTRGTADIIGLQIGPSTYYPGDSFAVDDLRAGVVVPEPSSFILVGLAGLGLGILRRKSA